MIGLALAFGLGSFILLSPDPGLEESRSSAIALALGHPEIVRTFLALGAILALILGLFLAWSLSLRLHDRHLSLLIDTMPAYVFAKDYQGRYILANRAMAEFYRTRPEAMMGLTDADLGMTREDFVTFRDQDRKVISSGESLFVAEHPGVRLDRSPGWFQTTKVPYRRPGTKRSAILGITIDITELKEAKERLKESEERYRQLAHQDALTGLPNRAFFSDLLGRALALARRSGTSLALAFLDLDRFKEVNDSLGHEVGDLLLKEAAGRMQASLRASDVVGRIGGDEFIILLQGVEGTEAARRAAEKLKTALGEAYHLAGKEVAISASIGLALFPDQAGDEAGLARLADKAMYRSKAEGRNRVTVYTRDPT